MSIKKKYGIRYIGVDGCIALTTTRGKWNSRTVSQAIENDNNVDAGAYFQIHVKSYEECDPTLYDDGETIILIPMDSLVKVSFASAAVPMVLKGDCCQCCGTKIESTDWTYCPVCGQAIKWA